MRPGPARDPKRSVESVEKVPNTAKLMAQLIKIGRNRGCTLEYLQVLLKDEWDRATRPR